MDVTFEISKVKHSAMWVQAVYAYGAAVEKKLSSFAILSPSLANVPYRRLGKFVRPTSAP